MNEMQRIQALGPHVNERGVAHSYDEPLTEEWLRLMGFTWAQLDRQPSKHWLLWIGSVCGRHISYEDLGVEVAESRDGDWFCWLRADTSHRYSRFLHVRYLRTQRDLIRLLEGLTGRSFVPADCLGGVWNTSEIMARIRLEWYRLDQQIMRESTWSSAEKDDSLAGALPQHLSAHLDKQEGR